jgi:hypothetical protein
VRTCPTHTTPQPAVQADVRHKDGGRRTCLAAVSCWPYEAKLSLATGEQQGAETAAAAGWVAHHRCQ